jgi:3-phosphoshikimate 1-carboxyvinyltransferase
MRRVEVSPGVAEGTVEAPPSKSYTHRALVAGHLTGSPYRIVRALDAVDTRATALGLKAFGTVVRRSGPRWDLRPGPTHRRRTVRCGDSGTTYRLLTAVAALSERSTRFSGSSRLGGRPMQPLLAALQDHGAACHHGGGSTLPLSVAGPLGSGPFRVSGSESSQFTSALLFVLPRLKGSSTLNVVGPRVSAPYVEATVAVLKAHRVRLSGSGGRWTVPGDQTYRSDRFEVPGDASSAAYLWAAGSVSGGSVTVTGVSPQWPQADLALLPILRAAGVRVRANGGSVTVSGTATGPFDAELTQAPDLFPLLGALAAVTPGTSFLRGASHVAQKESDRRSATVALIRRLGGRVRSRSEALEITGTSRVRALRGAPWDDHRIVMSAAVASLRATSASSFDAPGAVQKSFPGFWSALRQLGVGVRYCA